MIAGWNAMDFRMSHPEWFQERNRRRELYLDHTLFKMIFSFPPNHSLKPFMVRLVDQILVTERPHYSPENELGTCKDSVLLEGGLELNAILLSGFKAGNSKLYFGKDEILSIPQLLRIHNTNFDRNNLL